MPIKVVTSASVTPVSITTALRHLRALENDVDMVWLYLQAATDAVERYTGRSFVTKVFRFELPAWTAFPLETDMLLRAKGGLRFLELRRSPLLAIDHLKYYPWGSSTLTTWDASNYFTDSANLPGRVVIKDIVQLPEVEPRHDAIQVQFQAGYGTKESDMPAEARMAVLHFTKQMFDRRDPVEIGMRALEVPLSLRYMLRALRVDSLTPEQQ